MFLNRKTIHNCPSYFQAGQDLFVLHALQRKRRGIYLEIGSANPIVDNNTFVLEREFDWTGVSLEFREESVREFNAIRKNPCIAADAVSFNYKSYLDNNSFPRQIDYLQVDIAPAVSSLQVLKNLPHEDYRFSVITFEHERFAVGDKVMEDSREFLSALGYRLAVANVAFEGNDFEDWWIDPSVVPENAYKMLLQSSERNYPGLLNAIID